MKRKTVWILLAAALLAVAASVASASAAGGSETDPLISLGYLNGTFLPRLEAAIDERLAAVPQNDARESGWTEKRLKQDDALSGQTGALLLPLAGELTLRFPSGAVIDVTDGVEVASGARLTRGHRYLIAEDTEASVTVASKTAVLDFRGAGAVAASGRPDYYAMADVLSSLTLLQGDGSGVGGGFSLDRVPTRIEALVMLLRLLGEEDAALASDAALPFDDVPDWAARYAAYAYERGYSNGTWARTFDPDAPVSAAMYVEFILRALGYSSTAHTDLSDALERAEAAGVLTPGEAAYLRGTDFVRADIAYLSYYALEVPHVSYAVTLHEKLENENVFTAERYASVRSLVASARL